MATRILQKAAIAATALLATASLGGFLLANTSPTATAGTSKAAKGPRCDPANRVKFTVKKKSSKVNERDEVVNRTKNTISRAAHFEKTSTLAFNVSGGVEATFKALIFSEVKAHINAGVDKSSTVRSGYADTIKIPKGYKLTATKGWRTQKTEGAVYHIYSNCAEKNLRFFKSTAPYSTYVSYKTTKL